jgi:hypothetical protein
MSFRPLLCVALGLLYTTAPVFHGLARAATLDRPLDPVVLEGADVPGLIGLDPERIVASSAVLALAGTRAGLAGDPCGSVLLSLSRSRTTLSSFLLSLGAIVSVAIRSDECPRWIS